MSMEFTCKFQPQQIVSLEHEGARLYAEVIQVAQSRQMCWVRPLMLVEFSERIYPSFEPRLYDLRSSADLLWPIASFQPALDTEVMPLLVQLLSLEPRSNNSLESSERREPHLSLSADLTAAAQLNQFIHRVWQTLPSTL